MTDHEAIAFDYAATMPAKPLRFGAVEAKRRIRLAQAGEFFHTTGISTLDKYLRLRPGTYTVIAAESGVGKTALALQVAETVEQTKRQRNDERATLVFSAEMMAAELVQRMAASRTGISVWQMESGNLTDEQVAHLEDTIDAISVEINFQVDENDSPDRDHIFKTCEIIEKSYGLSMVIFDYIELAVSDERHHAEHVRSVAKTLKNVAKHYDIPVIGISQVNKDVRGRANKRPEMTDLRYGGHEPADAVVIMQEIHDMITGEDQTAIKAWVVKNRGGKKNVAADMLFHGPTTTFFPGDFRQLEL